MAQSALSQQISRLEHELGAPLFVRGKRGAELTPAGELLLPHARRIVADEAWARAEMRSYLGLEKGRLTIGMIQTSASGVDVAGAVAEFSQRYPGIELHIVDQTTAEMVEGVRRGPLDLAVIGIGPDELPDGLESRQLAVEPLVGVVSEKLADGLVGPVSIADLLGRGQADPVRRGHRHPQARRRGAGPRRPRGVIATRAEPGLGPGGVRRARARGHDRAPHAGRDVRPTTGRGRPALRGARSHRPAGGASGHGRLRAVAPLGVRAGVFRPARPRRKQ